MLCGISGDEKQACQREEILRGLVAGGFDFDILGWKEDDRLRSLAISLAKNTGASGRFHRLKNGTFGLRSWYDEDFLKKAALGAEAQAEKGKRKSQKKASQKKQSPKVQTRSTAKPQDQKADESKLV